MIWPYWCSNHLFYYLAAKDKWKTGRTNSPCRIKKVQRLLHHGLWTFTKPQLLLTISPTGWRNSQWLPYWRKPLLLRPFPPYPSTKPIPDSRSHSSPTLPADKYQSVGKLYHLQVISRTAQGNNSTQGYRSMQPTERIKKAGSLFFSFLFRF